MEWDTNDNPFEEVKDPPPPPSPRKEKKNKILNIHTRDANYNLSIDPKRILLRCQLDVFFPATTHPDTRQTGSR